MNASTPDWLNHHASTQFAYLTTTGRTSGDPHRIEIWFGVYAGAVYLMSGGGDRSDWVKNLIANPEVSIEIDGETLQGTARVIAPDEPDDALARDLLVTKYQKADELADWRERSLPIVITIPEAAA